MMEQDAVVASPISHQEEETPSSPKSKENQDVETPCIPSTGTDKDEGNSRTDETLCRDSSDASPATVVHPTTSPGPINQDDDADMEEEAGPLPVKERDVVGEEKGDNSRDDDTSQDGRNKVCDEKESVKLSSTDEVEEVKAVEDSGDGSVTRQEDLEDKPKEDGDDVVEVPNADSQIEEPQDIASMLHTSFREEDDSSGRSQENDDKANDDGDSIVNSKNSNNKKDEEMEDVSPRRPPSAAAAAQTIVQDDDVDMEEAGPLPIKERDVVGEEKGDNKDDTSQDGLNKVVCDEKESAKLSSTDNDDEVEEVIAVEDSGDVSVITVISKDEVEGKPEAFTRVRMDIFEDDDDVVEVPNEDSQIEDPPDIASMLHMSFREEDDSSSQSQENEDKANGDPIADSKNSNNSKDEEMEDVSPRRPRRAAAAAAAQTIRQISTKEASDREFQSRRARSSRDIEYDAPYREETENRLRTYSSGRKCQTCKRMTPASALRVQEFGTELYFCNNQCFAQHRSMKNSSGRMPCAKCGRSNMHLLTDIVTYYWETMNFCADTCVAKYQVTVGGKCATCSKIVAWNCLGKYCVRFGSDIRQFCSAQCLETYKKGARVCFHCQLDIKRLGNVILANLPSKQSPKEFCSQDCVEMYVEANLNQSLKSKTQTYICVICATQKSCYRELVLPLSRSTHLKTCSETCWKTLLDRKSIVNPVPCDTCTKFINQDYSFEPTSHFLSTNEKVYGFCSATCKNVYVLKNRQILSCVTCKVKKYNYDLVQVFQGRNFCYAVCSLNCLPVSPQQMKILQTASAPTASALVNGKYTDVENVTVPVINSITSISMGNTMSVGSGTETEDGWDGILRYEDVEALLKLWKPAPEMKSKAIMTKPTRNDCSTQTEDSALKEMDRVPFNVLEIDKYIPFPMPIPVFIPVPVYMMETPVPCPFPMVLPFPIPFLMNLGKGNETLASPNTASTTSANTGNEVEMMDVEVVPPEGEKEKDQNPSSDLINGAEGSKSTTSTESGSTTAISSNSTWANIAGSASKKKMTRVDYSVRAWSMSFGSTVGSILKDPATIGTAELAKHLEEWVRTGRKPNGDRYRADTLIYLCIGIQQHLEEHARQDNFFHDPEYVSFVDAITSYAEQECAQGISTRVEDSNFWESHQLGDSSPGILLFTIIYFFYKHFHLKTWEEHAALEIQQIKISGTTKKVLQLDSSNCASIEVEELPSNSQQCPVRLVQLYLDKRGSSDGKLYQAINPTYREAESSWFTSEPLNQMQIYKMLVIAMMIKSDER